MQHQEGVKDCGLFAIAFTTYLAHGKDSRLLPNCQFNQSLFCSHLFACFDQKAIQNFFYIVTLHTPIAVYLLLTIHVSCTSKSIVTNEVYHECLLH